MQGEELDSVSERPQNRESPAAQKDRSSWILSMAKWRGGNKIQYQKCYIARLRGIGRRGFYLWQRERGGMRFSIRSDTFMELNL